MTRSANSSRQSRPQFPKVVGGVLSVKVGAGICELWKVLAVLVGGVRFFDVK